MASLFSSENLFLQSFFFFFTSMLLCLVCCSRMALNAAIWLGRLIFKLINITNEGEKNQTVSFEQSICIHRMSICWKEIQIRFLLLVLNGCANGKNAERKRKMERIGFEPKSVNKWISLIAHQSSVYSFRHVRCIKLDETIFKTGQSSAAFIEPVTGAHLHL